MGTFFQPLTLLSEQGASETVEALVDTSSTFSTVPAPLLVRLGIAPFAKARLRLASGQVVERDIGSVDAELDGQPRRPIICVFGDAGGPNLIGAQTLESFLLGVDPEAKRLIPVDGWWA
jgi:predicted aspartyl protease